MRETFPDALGSGYRHLIDGLSLPDPDDRHVLAPAFHYEADFLVTQNLRDFPPAHLAPLRVKALTADDFVELLGSTNEERLARAADRHRRSLKRNPYTPEQYLDSLRAGFLPRFADRLAAQGFLVQPRP